MSTNISEINQVVSNQGIVVNNEEGVKPNTKPKTDVANKSFPTLNLSNDQKTKPHNIQKALADT